MSSAMNCGRRRHGACRSAASSKGAVETLIPCRQVQACSRDRIHRRPRDVFHPRAKRLAAARGPECRSEAASLRVTVARRHHPPEGCTPKATFVAPNRWPPSRCSSRWFAIRGRSTRWCSASVCAPRRIRYPKTMLGRSEDCTARAPGRRGASAPGAVATTDPRPIRAALDLQRLLRPVEPSRLRAEAPARVPVDPSTKFSATRRIPDRGRNLLRTTMCPREHHPVSRGRHRNRGR